ncbi:MAG: SLBB domain-containing protein [Phycisphaerae bacterium]|nr:SLBB domain-containing protein [Phycisphaerae bacterium]
MNQLKINSTVSASFVLMVLFTLVLLTGCKSPKLVDSEQYRKFLDAGPVMPVLDRDALLQAQVADDIYRVVIGDVLTLHLPSVLTSVSPQYLDEITNYSCRVSKQGEITLPIVGQIKVAGKDLDEIEQLIIKAYYPKYVPDRPSIIAQVAEYHTQSVSIIGAVNAAGTYRLRNDEMSLIALLMKAGGIVGDGASAITIKKTNAQGGQEPLILPVKGFSIPFADIALAKGDIVEVEPLTPEVFTVIGLVRRPGAFPYPSESQYNVFQAIAFAGGVNDVADPQYIRVYRMNEAGEIIDATFKLDGEGIANASTVKIRPGDVVSLEQTSRTKSRLMFAEVFKFNFGMASGVQYRYLQGRDTTTRE